MELRTRSEICEDLAIRWQYSAICELNGLLKKHGIVGRNVREEVLTKFFLHVAAELDGAPVVGIEYNGRQYRPMLVFLEEDGKSATLHVSDTYDLHDYAHSHVWDILDKEDKR